MCQCRYFILENISFVVIWRQADFLNVDCHHIMLVGSYTSHVCSRSLLTKQSLKILLVSHLSSNGLVYAFCSFLFSAVAFQHRINFRSKTDKLFDGVSFYLVFYFTQHLLIDCTVGRMVAGVFTCVIKIEMMAHVVIEIFSLYRIN